MKCHAHRDHAFEYFWETTAKPANEYAAAKLAFNRAHMLYCRNPQIIIERPPVMGWYIMFAIGVVVGMGISLLTFFLTVTPN